MQVGLRFFSYDVIDVPAAYFAATLLLISSPRWLVFSRLDHGNALLAGLPQSSLAPYQRVIQACQRSAAQRSRYFVSD